MYSLKSSQRRMENEKLLNTLGSWIFVLIIRNCILCIAYFESRDRASLACRVALL